MQKFDVYPKEGTMFTVEMPRFEVRDGAFALADEVGRVSTEGFLSFGLIAAIIPQGQRKDNNTIPFNIFLKGIEKTARVNASTFDMSDGKIVKFMYQMHDLTGDVVNEYPIEGIYVAASEVVGIFPDDGLKNREWR